MLTQEDILRTLGNVVDQKAISGITLREGGKVGFVVTLAPTQVKEKARLQAACEKAVMAIPGVTSVTAVLTAEGKFDDQMTRLPDDQKRQGSSDHLVIGSSSRARAVWNTDPIPHVRRLIAIASGKGGVGKSTTAVNLAHAMYAQGLSTGLLDADIYGPSIPRMMGLKGTPEAKEGKIIPPVAHGIRCMSMGLLVGEEAALVWRGPQMSKALAQLLRGVAWGTEVSPLDTLLVDMPPGTGDIHLSLVQQAPLDGAVIVTTPQDVAVADARKCIDMFRKVRVPVLGVIENMSGFTDPITGAVHAIFGTGGGKRLAEACGVSFLGEIPIEIRLREASDAGVKFEDEAGIYNAIAEKLRT